MRKPSTSMWWLATLLILLATAPARAAAADPEADQKAVERWLSTYSASLNKGDLAAFGSLWADDADWAPPDAPMLSGRAAIVAFVRETLDKHAFSHSFTNQAFKLVEGFGVAKIAATEKFAAKAGGAAGDQHVRGVIILRRSGDGSWVGTHYVWNRDASPPR